MTCYIRNMEKDKTFQMRHTEAWMQAIDDWRFKQAAQRRQDVSKAEAIRELVEQALRQDNWMPPGCKDRDSCHHHDQCMYLGCIGSEMVKKGLDKE